MKRRDFVTATGITILESHLVRGSQANSAIRVGLLGCGRRGSGDATNIANNTSARIVALADLFPDQLEKAKARFNKLADSKGYAGIAQTFDGPTACQQMMASKEVDAVVIATPAYYHPEHLAAAVAAGKHVYCEKPVAVDVFGAKRVLDIGKKAEGRLSLDVGFQIRSAPPFVELVRRIHAGALGEIAAGEAHYYCPWPDQRTWTNTGATLRLRNWIQDRVLSGDIIVEQNIHAIDICNWVLQGHPVKAIGRGGSNGRRGKMQWSGDDCYSHFDVVYHYPNDVHVSFNSTQFGKGPFEVSERFFGTKGAAVSPYTGLLGISGEEIWTWAGSEQQSGGALNSAGNFSDNLAQADSEKQKAFIASIESGKLHNQAAAGVETVLTAILGRQAAYSGHEVTWDQMLKSNEHWDAGFDVAKLALS